MNINKQSVLQFCDCFTQTFFSFYELFLAIIVEEILWV